MTVYEYTVQKPNHEEVNLASYKGKPLLIVNTASKCGLAPQFEGLQKLHENYGDKGLQVLGFPCDQFNNQEFDDIEQTTEHCKVNYGVSFPMFAKVKVNGKETHPLFEYLKNQQKGMLSKEIKWNFTKFLVDKEGNVVKRYAPTTPPDKIEEDIKSIL
ncbi:glutathione peroxidase [Jeotgalibacillus malaysiensis]|uniref:Glutathione peroxidase n=1 Tax=Jeotgalibacillus malaysiensis TaxID=1508404 RepID=A0A0B5ANS0_9BACL|nr:glutathione peroxidase [Jeotgalibacillus malaysiensis]AJD89664.1 glutathione peroxidase [Jeotgalibacillus malaysiensis]